MTENEFRELLVNTVKACGEELIERADDFVGDCDHVCDFNISIHFPISGPKFEGVPTITVTREHCSTKSIDVIMDSLWKGE